MKISFHKKLILLLIAILLISAGAAASGCDAERSHDATGDVLYSDKINEMEYIDAVVLQINGSSILARSTGGSSGAVGAGSELVFSIAGFAEDADFPQLKQGDSIRIYFDGMVMESYPLQLSAVYDVVLCEG